MAESVLAAQELSKTYRQRSGFWQREALFVQAAQSVSFTLQRGERLGLVGESGCGKSTVAKMLVGLVRPTSGAIVKRGKVQLIFQDPMNSLNPRLTVGEALREPLLIHRLAPRAEWPQRVHNLLASVQLPARYATRLPRQLSGGERQRVGIARALAVDPDVLICDEPIASLDISVGTAILELLKRLSEERALSLLFISHDLRAVAWLCQRVCVMQQGRLIEQGNIQAVLSRPQQAYTQQLLAAARLEL